jgi:hypothetical protein
MSFARALLWSDFGVLSYTVHEPPAPSADRLDRAEQLVFVKDGFTYAAAAFAPVWLIANRLWLAFAAYLAVLVLLLLGVAALDGPSTWLLLGSSALHLLLGYEADSIQRFTLARRGYRQIGAVSGRSETECERRFLESWLPEPQRPSPLGPISAAIAAARPLPAPAPAAVTTEPEPPQRRGWRGLFGRRRT